ncbi:protein kinase [Streptomyces sp. NPDC052396]|uniref:protein kinase domain-containing protein n=1 Tax=Streptomyces sp. NPDC052396 TaxID=3365689 RepID=UPI0037CD0581
MSQDGAQGRYTGRSVGGGRYQLLDLLGEGGMAAVHLAYDSALDRNVAIKTLHTELGRESSFRERFRREAQSVAKLTHTNIVSVFDTGEDSLDGTTMPYIVMEYIEGKPLRSALDEDVAQYGAMPTAKALKITSDVLAALEVSHEMGLVHRDIKPGNVMMTKRDVVKVMDFGIARAMQSGVTSMTQTGMVVGTPQYLSPEQALGRGVDARSDLYSVGIMLFELLTGRLPFNADSPLAIAYAHVQEEPVAPSTINHSIPPAVDALVARALKKNPNERFPSAAAMRDEIDRIAGTAHTAPSPVISAAAPPPRDGAGISSTVFPPVDQQAAPGPQGVQTPYQPGPYNSPYSAPTPTPAYQQPAPAYQTPAPMPAPTPMPAPAPAAKSNRTVIAGSSAVAILAVIGVIVAIVVKHGGSSDNTKADPKQSHSVQPAAPQGNGNEAKFKDGDKTKTIELTKCTQARDSFDDKTKKTVPDFTYLYIDSVKQCFQAASWRYKVVQQDENLWGKGMVIAQNPTAGDSFDPNSTITLTVSTGQPGSS